MTYPRDEVTGPYKQEEDQNLQNKLKIDQLDQLKRESEFLEREMERVKTKLQNYNKNLL